MTSFATELPTPSVTEERTDTLPRLIYKDGLHVAQQTKHVAGQRFLCGRFYDVQNSAFMSVLSSFVNVYYICATGVGVS